MVQSRYTVVYSNDIKIFDKQTEAGASIPIREFPFGVINTNGFQTTLSSLKKHGLEEKFNFPEKKQIVVNNINFKEGYTPRNYQYKTVQSIVESQKNCGVIEAPTGSGKTNIAILLIATKNIPTLVIVPSSQIAYQTKSRISKTLELDMNKVGLITDGKREFDKDILIATWQSLQNPYTFKKIKNYGYNMVIVDEAHRASARILKKIISSLNAEYKFGFSATAYKGHEEQMRDINKVLGKIIIKIPIEMLYESKYLIRPQIELFSTQTDISIELGIMYYFRSQLENNEKMRWALSHRLFKELKYKIFAPEKRTIKNIALEPTSFELNLLAKIAKDDYEEKNKKNETKKSFSQQLGLAKVGIDLYTPRFNKIVSQAKQFFKKDNGRGVILFNTIEAGQRMYETLNELGFSNLYIINGQTENNYKTIEDISSGAIAEYLIISTTQFLSEGSDIPALSDVLIGSPIYPPFADAERMQQAIGRGMRPDELRPNKKCRIKIADDTTIGWISPKKIKTYSIIDNVIKPQWVDKSKGVVLVIANDTNKKKKILTHFQDALQQNKKDTEIVSLLHPVESIVSEMFNISIEELNRLKEDEKFSLENSGKFILLKEINSIKETYPKTDILKKFIISFQKNFDLCLANEDNIAKKMLGRIFGENGEKATFMEVIYKTGYCAIKEEYGTDFWISKTIESIQFSQSDVVFVSSVQTNDEVEAIKNIFKKNSTISLGSNSSNIIEKINTITEMKPIVSSDYVFKEEVSNTKFMDEINMVIKDKYKHLISSDKKTPTIENDSEREPTLFDFDSPCVSY